MKLIIAGLALLAAALPAQAGSLILEPATITEWKAMDGRVSARSVVPARVRSGGTLVTLLVSEGDKVSAGQIIATVRDEKLAFQAAAVEAQQQALKSQLANAEADLTRGEALIASGAATAQRFDQLRTQVEVLRNQIAAAEAQRNLIAQQQNEGDILAPIDGLVLDVPVTRGTVLMPGETVASLGGGGFFLRLSVPERHAARLREGDSIAIETDEGSATGRLAMIYPRIENGRVTADVDVPNLPATFIGARLLVRLPVGERQALLVPASALRIIGGLDFVDVARAEGTVTRTVITGERLKRDGADFVEILSGLAPGDAILTP